MWQLGGDFQGISWGLPGDFISYGGISSKMLGVLLGFRGDFGETTYPYYNIKRVKHMPICPKCGAVLILWGEHVAENLLEF